MFSIHQFLLLITILEVYCKEEYIPTLIWTSREFQERKNVDYLVMKNVKSDLFEAYLMEILGTKKPLMVVFLEQDLGTHDFEWRDDKRENSFPFLSELTVKTRVDYFRSVESPFQTIKQLDKKGFNLKTLKPGMKFDFNEGDFLLFEFETIKTQRPEIIKKHDKQMEEIHQQLVDSGKNWIVVYTARHSREGGFSSDFVQMSPWHVEKPFQEKSKNAISLYQDEVTGFALIIKGTLQLLLPSPKNLAVKVLEKYIVASAKSFKNLMDFVIFFPNYTLTFHLTQVRENWIINGAKLLNGNGDSLQLTPRQGPTRPKNKCYVQLTEFQTQGKPLVKVILSKYKFLKLKTQEEPCKKPYAFELTLCLILGSIACGVVLWNRMIKKLDFTVNTKAAKVSTEDLFFVSSRNDFSPLSYHLSDQNTYVRGCERITIPVI